MQCRYHNKCSVLAAGAKKHRMVLGLFSRRTSSRKKRGNVTAGKKKKEIAFLDGRLTDSGIDACLSTSSASDGIVHSQCSRAVSALDGIVHNHISHATSASDGIVCNHSSYATSALDGIVYNHSSHTASTSNGIVYSQCSQCASTLGGIVHNLSSPANSTVSRIKCRSDCGATAVCKHTDTVQISNRKTDERLPSIDISTKTQLEEHDQTISVQHVQTSLDTSRRVEEPSITLDSDNVEISLDDVQEKKSHLRQEIDEGICEKLAQFRELSYLNGTLTEKKGTNSDQNKNGERCEIKAKRPSVTSRERRAHFETPAIKNNTCVKDVGTGVSEKDEVKDYRDCNSVRLIDNLLLNKNVSSGENAFALKDILCLNQRFENMLTKSDHSSEDHMSSYEQKLQLKPSIKSTPVIQFNTVEKLPQNFFAKNRISCPSAVDAYNCDVMLGLTGKTVTADKVTSVPKHVSLNLETQDIPEKRPNRSQNTYKYKLRESLSPRHTYETVSTSHLVPGHNQPRSPQTDCSDFSQHPIEPDVDYTWVKGSSDTINQSGPSFERALEDSGASENINHKQIQTEEVSQCSEFQYKLIKFPSIGKIAGEGLLSLLEASNFCVIANDAMFDYDSENDNPDEPIAKHIIDFIHKRRRYEHRAKQVKHHARGSTTRQRKRQTRSQIARRCERSDSRCSYKMLMREYVKSSEKATQTEQDQVAVAPNVHVKPNNDVSLCQPAGTMSALKEHPLPSLSAPVRNVEKHPNRLQTCLAAHPRGVTQKEGACRNPRKNLKEFPKFKQMINKLNGYFHSKQASNCEITRHNKRSIDDNGAVTEISEC